jgi:hypothetical protein
MLIPPSLLFLSLGISITATGTNVILSNDDGWAELNVRTFFSVLTSAPYVFNVVLSAPAQDESGTGSKDVPPTVLKRTCEFNTCPVGSPAEGFNGSDREPFSLLNLSLCCLLSESLYCSLHLLRYLMYCWRPC